MKALSQRWLPALLAVALVSPSRVAPGDAQPVAGKARDESGAPGHALEMLQAAKQTYKACTAHYADYIGELAQLDQMHAWSMRWMKAQQRVAKTGLEERKAVEEHLGRVKELQTKIKTPHAAGVGGSEEVKVRACEYYVAEANDLRFQLSAPTAPKSPPPTAPAQ